MNNMAVIGPSGAGKTWWLHSLLALCRCPLGEIKHHEQYVPTTSTTGTSFAFQNSIIFACDTPGELNRSPPINLSLPAAIASAELLVLVVDVSLPVDRVEIDALYNIVLRRKDTSPWVVPVLVAAKIDLARTLVCGDELTSRLRWLSQLSEEGGFEFGATSAVTGEGILGVMERAVVKLNWAQLRNRGK